MNEVVSVSSEDPKGRLEAHLEDAGLATDRFIDVLEGKKATIDHEQHPPDQVAGNYGVYANAEDQLAILDIDDYGDLDDKSGMTALHQLPLTLEQGSPHGGTHKFYRVEPTEEDRLIAAALKDTFGSENLNPSWGEVRVANQYVVGAGSQLDGCDKEWCDECAESDGGYYVLQQDAEIATVSAEEFILALSSDPALTESDDEETDAPTTVSTPEPPEDVAERLETAREMDESLDRLMRGDYSEYGGDRSKSEYVLAYRLAFWLGPDRGAVERVLDHHARTKKWAEREDRSYRDSVLAAVDEQDEFYSPSKDDGATYSPDVDWEEVDRGEAILDAQRGITDPYGTLVHRDGQYGYEFERTDSDGNPYTEFVAATNFTLELDFVIETYEGKLLTLTVHPASPMEDPYQVEVHPTVFNSSMTFSEEVVRGRTTYFNPPKDASDVLRDLRLTVGHQNAPSHRGTEYIGLHGGDYEEWVTPAGTLGVEGWLDTPEYKYYEKGGSQEMESSLEDKWALDPDDGAEFDEQNVADICARVPKVRTPDRGLPILGWFYAAALKPIVHSIEGEFNLLQVTGTTETGKTSTLQLFYELFGADPAPFGCGDTRFTIEKKFAGSRGLPIWLDEYKPSDLDDRKLNWLHRRLREVTRAKTVSKGQADLGEISFKMRAPVVFSGEQTVTEAAVRRRTVMTQLTDRATEGRHQRAFCELTGASYTDDDGEEHYPDGLELRDHALAFYRHILRADPKEYREAWQEARERTREHLKHLHVPDLDGSEFQGLQTVVFGIAVYRQFARNMGVDEDALPTSKEVPAALEHIVSNIGPGGRRREHIDEFTELMAQAASADYLEEHVHHRVYEPQMADEKAVAFHMPTTFSAVKKYVREYNLDDEYDILGKNDYVDGFREKAESETSYPLAVNHRVRNIENGSKAVVIDPHRAQTVLPDGFNLSAFTEEAVDDELDTEADGDDHDGDGVTALADIEPGYVTIEAEAASVLEPKPWLQAEGTLADGTARVDYQARGDSNPAGFDQGEWYRVENAKVTKDENGVLVLELRDGVTEVEQLATDDSQQSGLDAHGDEAAADGGEEITGRRGQVIEYLRENQPAGIGEIAGGTDLSPDETTGAVETLATRGDVMETDDGDYEIRS